MQYKQTQIVPSNGNSGDPQYTFQSHINVQISTTNQMIVPQQQGQPLGIAASNQPLNSFIQPPEGYGQQQQSARLALYDQMNIERGPSQLRMNYPSSANGSRYPITIQCPYCGCVVMTQIDEEIGLGTVLASFLILIVFWPLFWIPCCMRDCQNIVHHCSRCSHEVGVKKYSLC